MATAIKPSPLHDDSLTEYSPFPIAIKAAKSITNPPGQGNQPLHANIELGAVSQIPLSQY